LALIYLHGRRITHRDIKAENVVIEQGRVKLIDFGLASQEHKLRQVAGTKVYMAPEILR
jgi:serine/threonine protein kinase